MLANCFFFYLYFIFNIHLNAPLNMKRNINETQNDSSYMNTDSKAVIIIFQ
jgi:hypothetical protein